MQTAPLKSSPRLYESVRARVVDRLQSGEWSPGARLPTETQLAEEFGVGIGTIRRAVGELVAEGLLVRRARLGTTVARHGDDHRFEVYFNFVDAEGRPVRPAARLLSLKKERANPEVARVLRLERGARVARVENLRLLDGAPLMLDRLWVPLDRFADLDADSFKSRPSSIYAFYQERYGLSVVRVVEDLGACTADADLATALQLDPGAALLQVQRTAYTFNDVPVEYRHRFVNSAAAQYRNVRGLQD